jgi:hypothetical protein
MQQSAHKHAAAYALERDERSTMCDVLSTEVRAVKERLASVELALDQTTKV